MRDFTSSMNAHQLDVRRLTRAVVKVAAPNRLTLMIDENTELVGVPALSSSPTYAVNDLVILARDASGPLVVGRLGVSSTPAVPVVEPPPPVVPPPSAKTKYVKTILPASTGSWRGGSWRTDDTVRQGDWGGYGINQGAAYYGKGLSGLGALLTEPRSLVLTYARQAGGVFAAQSPTVWTLAGTSRPAGAPTRLASTTGTAVAVDRTATFALPAAMADALFSGSAGGLGIYVGGASPYIVLSGRSDSSVSMTLRAEYFA